MSTQQIQIFTVCQNDVSMGGHTACFSTCLNDESLPDAMVELLLFYKGN